MHTSSWPNCPHCAELNLPGTSRLRWEVLGSLSGGKETKAGLDVHWRWAGCQIRACRQANPAAGELGGNRNRTEGEAEPGNDAAPDHTFIQLMLIRSRENPLPVFVVTVFVGEPDRHGG